MSEPVGRNFNGYGGSGSTLAVDTDDLLRASGALTHAIVALDATTASILALRMAATADASRALVVNTAGAVLAQAGEPVLAPDLVAGLEERSARARRVAALLGAQIDAAEAAARAARERVSTSSTELSEAAQQYNEAEAAVVTMFDVRGSLVTLGSGLIVGNAPGWWRDPSTWGSFGQQPGLNVLHLGALIVGNGNASIGYERLVEAAAPAVHVAAAAGVSFMITNPLYYVTLAERHISGKGTAVPVGVGPEGLTYHGRPVPLHEMSHQEITAFVTSVLLQEGRNVAESLGRIEASIPTPQEFGDAAAEFLVDTALGVLWPVPTLEDAEKVAAEITTSVAEIQDILSDDDRSLESRLWQSGGLAFDLGTSVLLPSGLAVLGGAVGANVGAAAGSAVAPGAGTATGAAAGREVGTEGGRKLGEWADPHIDLMAREVAWGVLTDPDSTPEQREAARSFARGLRTEDAASVAALSLLPKVPLLDFGDAVRVTPIAGVEVLDHTAPRVPEDVAGVIREIGSIKDPEEIRDSGLVQIDTRVLADGTKTHLVYVTGTDTFTDNWGGNPHDLASDLEGVAGLSSAQVAEVARSMDQAGVAPTDRVALVGHSGGGTAAMQVAADPVLRTLFGVDAVLAVGAPIGTADVPEDVRVLSLENRDDLVPGLDGTRLTPTEAHATVIGDVPPPSGGWSTPAESHLAPAYERLAQGAAAEGVPQYVEFEEYLQENFGLGSDVPVERRQFEAFRLAER